MHSKCDGSSTPVRRSGGTAASNDQKKHVRINIKNSSHCRSSTAFNLFTIDIQPYIISSFYFTDELRLTGVKKKGEKYNNW